MKSIVVCFAIALGVFSSAGSALAQPQQPKGGSVATTLSQWGLVGVWALDCAAPVSMANGRYGYVARPDGTGWHERAFGDPARDDRNEIVGARVEAGGALAVTVNFKAFKSVRTFAFVHDKAFRVRTMWNRSEAGDYTIRDGRFTDNGTETRWLERCEGTAVPRS